ncbi:hypothetical protein C8J56DRAFT_1170133, partial [Mycena floridula]
MSYYTQCSPQPLWNRENMRLPGLFRHDLRIHGPFLLNFKALSCFIHLFLPLLAFYHLRHPTTILERWTRKDLSLPAWSTVELTFRWMTGFNTRFPPAETTIGSIITVESTCAPHRTWAMVIYQRRETCDWNLMSFFDFSR